MMYVCGYEITTFTKLREYIGIRVLDIICKNFGEIGDFRIEDNEVYFRSYRDFFENAPKIIIEDGIELKRITKSDYHFTVGYLIFVKAQANPDG